MTDNKSEFYSSLLKQVKAILDKERDLIANAANLSAALWMQMTELNWVGFYFMKKGELVVGPFQGKPACTRIAVGKGVCGTSAETRQTLVVPDVHKFPGHIACDCASNSEIVIPLIKDDQVLGVLDIDSPIFDRFDDADKQGLTEIATLFVELCDWE